MLPSARLTQASFDDLDLILADNFARAAAKCGVEQIVYVGGLVPGDENLSPHLASRLEVERTLAAHGTPVTALRAAMVVGAGGSSLHILTSLVRRLPAMLTPKWTRSSTQPIALADLVRAVQHVLGDPSFAGAFDVGGPDVMTYRGLMERTAAVLGVTRRMLDVPLFTPGLSTLWVSLVSGAPRALVGPLVQSLRHDMVARDNPLQRWLAPDALAFEDALRLAMAEERPRTPRLMLTSRDRRRVRADRTVRSVQRLPRPDGQSARWIGEEYVRWLPSVPIPGLRCETDGPSVGFFLRPVRKPLLVLRLSDERSLKGRALFYIDGGLLARTDSERRGRFEMRITADGEHVLAAVHEFRPRLPWYLYNATQALAHLVVMHLFGRHLARLAGDQGAPRSKHAAPLSRGSD